MEPRTCNNKVQRARKPEEVEASFQEVTPDTEPSVLLQDLYYFLPAPFDRHKGLHLFDFCQFPLSYLRASLSLPSRVLLLTHLGIPPAFSGV